MTVQELKETIKDLPDDMPVVCISDDTPVLANCEKAIVTSACYHSIHGYDHAVGGKEKGKSINVFIINGI